MCRPSANTHSPSTSGRRSAAQSTGARQQRSSSSSSQVTVSEHPAMSRLVTYSPTSGATTVMPAAANSGSSASHSTRSSSILVAPRPFRSTATRPEKSRPSRMTGSNRARAISSGGARSTTARPASPWMPSPSAMRPSGTSNSLSASPGSVQPSKATPKERVRAFAWRPIASTWSMPCPASAAAPMILNTRRSPATPRRVAAASGPALATSSVVVTMRASIPSWRRRSAAIPKFRLSPA